MSHNMGLFGIVLHTNFIFLLKSSIKPFKQPLSGQFKWALCFKIHDHLKWLALINPNFKFFLKSNINIFCAILWI